MGSGTAVVPIVLGAAANTLPQAGQVTLQQFASGDAAALADYFDRLSPESRARFQPHPLTRDAAESICARRDEPAIRLVLWNAGAIVGYFILEPRMSPHEAARYAAFGIALESESDWLFAPSVADGYQGRGLASLAMPHLIGLAKRRGARSLVLMGGTQAGNARAIAFYEKFGFQRHGGYQTHVFNHDMRLVFEASRP